MGNLRNFALGIISMLLVVGSLIAMPAYAVDAAHMGPLVGLTYTRYTYDWNSLSNYSVITTASAKDRRQWGASEEIYAFELNLAGHIDTNQVRDLKITGARVIELSQPVCTRPANPYDPTHPCTLRGTVAIEGGQTMKLTFKRDQQLGRTGPHGILTVVDSHGAQYVATK